MKIKKIYVAVEYFGRFFKEREYSFHSTAEKACDYGRWKLDGVDAGQFGKRPNRVDVFEEILDGGGNKRLISMFPCQSS